MTFYCVSPSAAPARSAASDDGDLCNPSFVWDSVRSHLWITSAKLGNFIIELLKSILEQWDSDSGRPLANFFYNNTQTHVQ